MSQQASVALTTARTLLNDDAASLWDNTALLPKLAQAHRELQVQLRANACPITRATSTVSVNPNTTSPLTGIPDLLEPITLWERDITEPDSSFVRMTEYDPLPIVARTTRLIWWRWAQESLEFIGATTSRVVKVYYKRSINVPTLATDSLGIPDGEFYIAPRIAALAFGSTGNIQAATWCTELANNTIADILVANRGRSRIAQRP